MHFLGRGLNMQIVESDGVAGANIVGCYDD